MKSQSSSMWRYVLVPVHSDAWPFVGVSLIATAILYVWTPLGWLGLAATVTCVYFFRNPDRVTPVREGLIVSAADGVVEAVDKVAPPSELGMDPAPVVRVGVFLSLLDVHVARAPVAGTIVHRRHVPGVFLNASLDRASDENERLALRIHREDAPDVGVVLIAGQVARRIRCTLEIGDSVAVGERIGLIRFGSRVDVYLPPRGTEALVSVGQRTVAGETVLGDGRSQEPGRTGEVH